MLAEQSPCEWSKGMFFFSSRRRHTRSYGDWSSDVCSSDLNGNYLPDCDLRNPQTNGECGTISNLNFGQINPNATHYADDVIHGSGVRDYLWDVATEVQHQLGAGVSLTAGYYRNWYNNFIVTDNQEFAPGDFTPYCVTAPVDSRLPGGGGYQICGLSDVLPTKFGRVTNLVSRTDNYGDRKSTRLNSS